MIYFSPQYFADSPVFVKQPQDVTGDSGVEEKVEAVEASKRTITVSSLQLRGQRNMSGSVLQCEATNGNQAETVSTKIEVKIFRTNKNI